MDPIYSPRRMLLTICNALVLPFLMLIPKARRNTFLWNIRKWIYPLVRFMLFPAQCRERFRTPIWHNESERGKSERLILGFGGNSAIIDEFPEEFDQMFFADRTHFDAAKDCALFIPVIRQHSQSEYLAALMQLLEHALKDIDLHRYEKIYIMAHSLGGAIALQLIHRFFELYPEKRIILTLDRTLSSVADVAIGSYGIFGHLLERTLGSLWQFRSKETLELLSRDSRIDVLLIQSIPDSVLGPGLLSHCWPKHHPESWSTLLVDYGKRNVYHAAPFKTILATRQGKEAAALWLSRKD